MTTITWKKFLQDGNVLVEKSSEKWYWVDGNRNGQADSGMKYLRSVANVFPVNSNHQTEAGGGKLHDDNDDDDDDEIEDMENIMISEEDDTKYVFEKVENKNEIFLHEYDYDIVYCNIYRVPVLYFNGRNCKTSRRLGLDEVWKDVETLKLLEADFDNRLLTLSQCEHPVTGKMSYQLHPCYTAEMMKFILSTGKEYQNFKLNSETTAIKETTDSIDTVITEDHAFNFIISWLSFVGPVVGLNFSSPVFSS